MDCHVFRRNPAGEDEWLLMKRAPHILLGGTWQMVSGHIEGDEKAFEAALREMREETGLRVRHFYQASYVNRFYLAHSDEIVLSPVFCVEVAWEEQVRLSPEHTDYRWVSPEEAMDLLPWPGQRKALAVLREQFILREPLAQSCLDGMCDV